MFADPYPADQTDAVLLAGGDGDDHVFDVGGMGELGDLSALMSGVVPLPPAPLAGGGLVVLPQQGSDNNGMGPLNLGHNVNININLNVLGGGGGSGVPAVSVSSGLPMAADPSSPHSQAIAIFTSAELTILSGFQLVRPHLPHLQQQTAHARVWALQDELRGWVRYAHARVVDGMPAVADDRLQQAAGVVLSAAAHMSQAIPPSGSIQVPSAVDAILEALMGWPNLGRP